MKSDQDYLDEHFPRAGGPRVDDPELEPGLEQAGQPQSTYEEDSDEAYLARHFPRSEPEPEPEPVIPEETSGGFLDRAGDVAIDAAKSTVTFGQTVIGLGSLATGGKLSDGMRALGYDPTQTNEFLSDMYSDVRKEEEAEIEGAEGFVDSAGALLSNPAAIAGRVIETAPMMLTGIAAARHFAAKAGASAYASSISAGASIAAAKKIALEASLKAGSIAAATAEGVQAGGGSFDNYMEKGIDLGRAYTASIGTMVTTGLQSFVGGKLSKKLGLGGDLEAGGGSSGNFVTKGLKGGVQEGVFEEMPQSTYEQGWDNYANERPLDEGLGKAAGTGLVIGSASGAAFGAFSGDPATVEPEPISPISGEVLSVEENANAMDDALLAANNRVAESNRAQMSADELANLDAMQEQARTDKTTQMEQEVSEIDAQEQVYKTGAHARLAQVKLENKYGQTNLKVVKNRAGEWVLQKPGMASITEELSPVSDLDSGFEPVTVSLPERLEGDRPSLAEQNEQAGEKFKQAQTDVVNAERRAAEKEVKGKTYASQVAAQVDSEKIRKAHGETSLKPIQHESGEWILVNKTMKELRESQAKKDEISSAEVIEDEALRWDDTVDVGDKIPTDGIEVEELALEDISSDGLPEIGVSDVVADEEIDIADVTPDEEITLKGSRVYIPKNERVPAGTTFTTPEQRDAAEAEAIAKPYKSGIMAKQAIRKIEKEHGSSNLETSLENNKWVLVNKDGAAANVPRGTTEAQEAIEKEHATEPVEPTGEASSTAEGYSTAKPQFDGLILSYKPGDDRNGETTPHYYGEIAKTEDADGMPVDVVLNNKNDAQANTPVFIVNQNDFDTGKFRQHKVMAGFDTAKDAEKGYGEMWDSAGFGTIHELTADEFKAWLKDGNTKIEYKEPTLDDSWNKTDAKKTAAAKVTAATKVIKDTDDLLTFVRKHGGLNMPSSTEIPVGKFKHIDDNNKIVGLNKIEQSGDAGLSLADMTELAWQAKYISENNTQAMIEKLSEAEDGPVYNATGQEAQARAEQEAAYEAQLEESIENWTDYVGTTDLGNQVDPEMSRLIVRANSIDSDRTTDIASKDIDEADVKDLLQELIDENEKNIKNEAAVESETEISPTFERPSEGSTEEQGDFLGKTEEQAAEQSTQEQINALKKEKEPPIDRPSESQSKDDLFNLNNNLDFDAPSATPAVDESTAELIELDKEYQSGDLLPRELLESLEDIDGLPADFQKAVNDFNSSINEDFNEFGGRGDVEAYEADFADAFEKAIDKLSGKKDPVEEPPKPAEPEGKLEDVLSQSVEEKEGSRPLSKIKMTATDGNRTIRATADQLMNAIDDRIKAVSKLRGCV